MTLTNFSIVYKGKLLADCTREELIEFIQKCADRIKVLEQWAKNERRVVDTLVEMENSGCHEQKKVRQ